MELFDLADGQILDLGFLATLLTFAVPSWKSFPLTLALNIRSDELRISHRGLYARFILMLDVLIAFLRTSLNCVQSVVHVIDSAVK